MSIRDLFNEAPFAELLGIEITDMDDGTARGKLPYSEDLRSSNFGSVAHGAATYALADTVGGASVISLSQDVSPTVDMRIDYLSPTTTDLQAEAEVIRYGSNLAMTHVEVHDAEGTRVATAQGTYKIGGQGEETPWRDRAGQSADDEDT
jgi:uncharacterized protein (TIGR00369 family)